ncbi:MAG: heterodisulfide reductase-related iron-sulfur binding cluster [Aigarchaeota archaeon]|nr:heterodisulfide reductase-related iron-sulfur binding cluster [Aigarchaeota archaeon]
MPLKDYERDLIGCDRCSGCKWLMGWLTKSWRFAKVCPSSQRYLYDAYSAQGRLNIALRMLRGELTYEESPKLLEIIYKCPTCGACDVQCKIIRDMEPLEILHELRAKCVEDGVGPMPAHKLFAENIEKTNNPYGDPHEDRLRWLPKQTEVAEKADTAYFVGCTSAYRRPEIAQATVNILNATGTDFVLLHPDEHCCGSPLWRTGQRKQAERMMEHTVKAIEKSGVKRVVTSCAGCYSMLKVEYRRVMQPEFEVIHTAELIDTLLRDGKLKLKKSLDLKVTYHDPCHVGRQSEPFTPWSGEYKIVANACVVTDPPKAWRRGTDGCYEPPRRVLQSIPGVQLFEMERIKEYAFCCGAGGGVKSAFPDFALWAANERIEEAKATGADAIVSCCPFCATNLKDAIGENNEKIAFFDLTELVQKAM